MISDRGEQSAVQQGCTNGLSGQCQKNRRVQQPKEYQKELSKNVTGQHSNLDWIALLIMQENTTFVHLLRTGALEITKRLQLRTQRNLPHTVLVAC